MGSYLCRWTFLGIFLMLTTFTEFSKSELTLPFPSLVKEIQPTLSIYSITGDPPCFKLKGGDHTANDLVRIAQGHGAWTTPRVLFITHGFRDSEEESWLHVLKNALVTQRPQTVVIVGWSGGANLPHIKYQKAAGNIRSVGMWLGDIAKEIRRLHPKMYIWGIGHSLGAHLMGLAGRSSGFAFDRITALDPAGPFLETRNEDLRLKRTDAPLVDVIHPDGCTSKDNDKCWVSANNHYGTMMSLGTIDFYPNYGVLNPTTHPIDIGEAHKRAVNLFIVSIMHPGLFVTNNTIEGSPGQSSVQRILSVNVNAEMGYWLDTGFIPGPTDPRVNFYIESSTMKVVDRMGDVLVNQMGPGGHPGMRHRRDLVKAVDCKAMPGTGQRVNSMFFLSTLLSLSILMVKFMQFLC